MTLPHHDATHCDERSSRKTKFLGSKQCSDHYIAPSLQLAICLHADAAAQVIQQQDLLSFGKPELPWNTGVLNRTQRRGARTTTVTANQHYIGMSFGHAGSYCAYSNFRN